MPLGLELIALILEFIGTVLIAITALLVHKRVKKEHKIDKKVLRQIKIEEIFAYLGIILLILGFILNLIA